MGIDIHSLQLLQYNKQKNKKLGKTLTLGRYAVLVGSKLANKWVGTDPRRMVRGLTDSTLWRTASRLYRQFGL